MGKKPWENHGETMGKPWENHGETMGKPWENQGLKISCDFHGMERPDFLVQYIISLFNGMKMMKAEKPHPATTGGATGWPVEAIDLLR